MRIWDYRLLPYLPDIQFKGQLRELVLIMRQWRDKGHTNHLLINQVMDYPKNELSDYAFRYFKEYKRRYGKALREKYFEFAEFGYNIRNVFVCDNVKHFKNWHNQEYLRVCMSNLFEKYQFGRGKSRITETEWQRLLEGYKVITGEEYKI